MSAFYDITHGVGLAIVTPAWMRAVLSEQTEARFAMFARNVWDVTEADDHKAAQLGIEKTAAFFRSLGMPSTLKEVGIGREKFEQMAAEAVRTSGIAARSYVPLDQAAIVKLFESCAE